MEKVYDVVELGAGVGASSGAWLRIWSGPVLVLPTVFVLSCEASEIRGVDGYRCLRTYRNRR